MLQPITRRLSVWIEAPSPPPGLIGSAILTISANGRLKPNLRGSATITVASSLVYTVLLNSNSSISITGVGTLSDSTILQSSVVFTVNVSGHLIAFTKQSHTATYNSVQQKEHKIGYRSLLPSTLHTANWKIIGHTLHTNSYEALPSWKVQNLHTINYISLGTSFAFSQHESIYASGQHSFVQNIHENFYASLNSSLTVFSQHESIYASGQHSFVQNSHESIYASLNSSLTVFSQHDTNWSSIIDTRQLHQNSWKSIIAVQKNHHTSWASELNNSNLHTVRYRSISNIPILTNGLVYVRV